MDAKLLIGNLDLDAAGGKVFEVRSPITQAIVSRAPAACVADAAKAADAAAEAFPSWAQTSPNARRQMLLQCAETIERRNQEFSTAMTEETGAAASWGAFNVRLGAGMLREAASMTTQISGEVMPSDQPGCFAFSVREPAGVVLGIAPWNAPVILGARAVALPVACGNTVVLKSSEICPYTQYLLGDVFREAGLPAGVVNIVSNSPEQAGVIVEGLIAHRAVRRINFTGSTRVGRMVAEIAGRHLKPALLELRGKAPLIVLHDAGPRPGGSSGHAAFWSLHEPGTNLHVNGTDSGARIGRDHFFGAFEREGCLLEGWRSARAVHKSAPLSTWLRGKRPDDLIQVMPGIERRAGCLRRPTKRHHHAAHGVGTKMWTPSMKIYYEEAFGPIVSVIRGESEEEAIRSANDPEYERLTAAIFSADVLACGWELWLGTAVHGHVSH